MADVTSVLNVPPTSAPAPTLPAAVLPISKTKPERAKKSPVVVYDPGMLRSPATMNLLIPCEARMARVAAHNPPAVAHRA